MLTSCTYLFRLKIATRHALTLHDEGIALFSMRRHDCFQSVAILDEFDRPLCATQVLRQREQVRLSTRVPLAVAQSINLLGVTAGHTVPANVIPGPPDRSFDFRIFHVLTLTRRDDRWGAIDQ